MSSRWSRRRSRDTERLTIPRSDASRNETVLEVFHRFQVTQNTQLSFGLQLIANPGNAPDNETAGAFYARLRTSF